MFTRVSLLLVSQSEDSDVKASPDQTHHPQNDNGISVRHIVTEIEAICHPASCPVTPSSSSSSSLSLPPSSHSLQLIRPEPQEETEVTHVPFTPPSLPQSPSMLPSDWPAGSVRRATEQLEQKLRQEMEMAASPRSPLHSPSAEQPPLRMSPCSLSTEHPPLRSPQQSTEQRLTQGENTDVFENSKDREKHTGSQTELQRLNCSGTDNLSNPPRPHNLIISQVSGAIPITVHTFIDSHMLTQTQTSVVASPSQIEETSRDTSAHSQRQSQPHSQSQQCQTQPQACSHLISLDAVTVQESDTDERLESSSHGMQEGCGPGCDAQSRLAQGSQELERIQQTLRELQAFLHDGVRLEATASQEKELGQPQGLRDAIDIQPGPCKVVRSELTPPSLQVGQRFRERQEGKSFLETAGWHRAMELEARIRQAGLTPPSLMKRSASLAKLDCLELSATDLSDLDLRPQSRTTSSHSHDSFTMSPTHPDDTWKKQKVLAQTTCVAKTGLSLEDSTSPPPLCICPKEENCEREEPDGSRCNTPTTTSRQQGRCHSSRRSRKAEKKQRPVTLLYNTM